MSGCKTPSKFLSLDFLHKLRKNKCLSENINTGEFKEYQREEVDQLYFEKLEQKAELEVRAVDKLQKIKPMGEYMKEKFLTKKQSDATGKKLVKELNKIFSSDGFNKKDCWNMAKKIDSNHKVLTADQYTLEIQKELRI